MNYVTVGANNDLTLSLFASPWNPFQSSPTYPDRVKVTADSNVKTDHDLVFQRWVESLPEERKKKWDQDEAWRYDEIPTDVDILLTHVAPFGVLDRQPLITNWGSSSPLKCVLKEKKPRMVLFGHIHAQRGYWEKVDQNNIIGGVQYAKTTNEEVKNELMEGNKDSGIQFMANTCLMSDRTVQKFAKKKIVGKPRLIYGTYVPKDDEIYSGLGKAGEWHFHGIGGGSKY